MRKLNIEIHPYSRKDLSPRYHISKSMFTDLRDDKMEEFNACCETCGYADSKMELHESATIMDRTYILDGFYLLCQKCYDMVHCINISTNRFGVDRNTLDYLWKHEYDIKGRSMFKTKATFDKHVSNAFDQVFGFMMADQVSCDYSIAAKYGLDPKILKRGFEANYNHMACRIRYMLYCIEWMRHRDKSNDPTLEQRFYDMFDHQGKVKGRRSAVQAEYLKHKDYYDGNMVLYGVSCPEREKLIFAYAETMKLQLTTSKHKPKTKSK